MNVGDGPVPKHVKSMFTRRTDPPAAGGCILRHDHAGCTRRTCCCVTPWVVDGCHASNAHAVDKEAHVGSGPGGRGVIPPLRHETGAGRVCWDAAAAAMLAVLKDPSAADAEIRVGVPDAGCHVNVRCLLSSSSFFFFFFSLLFSAAMVHEASNRGPSHERHGDRPVPVNGPRAAKITAADDVPHDQHPPQHRALLSCLLIFAPPDKDHTQSACPDEHWPRASTDTGGVRWRRCPIKGRGVGGKGGQWSARRRGVSRSRSQRRVRPMSRFIHYPRAPQHTGDNPTATAGGGRLPEGAPRCG